MNDNQPIFNPYAQNLAIIKNYFKRPTVLTLGILYIISAVCNLATAFCGSSIFSAEDTSIDSVGAYSNMTSPIYFTASLLPSIIITVLNIIAYFVIYFKSKKEDPYSSPIAGVRILFVLAVIQLIVVSFSALIFILLFMFLAFSFFFMKNSNSINITDPEQMSVIALLLFILVLVAIILVYSMCYLRYIKSIKKSLTSVFLSHKGAGGFTCLSIAFAVVSILSLVMILLSIIVSNHTGGLQIGAIIVVLAIAISATTQIIQAVIASGYKNYILKITTDYSNNTELQQTTLSVKTQPAPAPNTQKQSEPQHEFDPAIISPSGELVETPECPRCGVPAKKDDVFCSSCGTKIK